jgi:hypothetical protein
MKTLTEIATREQELRGLIKTNVAAIAVNEKEGANLRTANAAYRAELSDLEKHAVQAIKSTLALASPASPGAAEAAGETEDISPLQEPAADALDLIPGHITVGAGAWAHELPQASNVA